MVNRIIDILKKNNIEVWRVTESASQTAELYFVKKQLDIPRFKDTKLYVVSVFCDSEENGRKFRGESNALLSPGMSDQEIESRIKSAYLAASFVKNPWFELADPVKEDKKPSISDMAGMDLKDSVMQFADAMFSVDRADDAFLNSVEIFAQRSSKRIVASNGLDVSFDFDKIYGEFVSQCITPIDVEQYRQFDYDNFNTKAIKAKVLEAIEDVRARARATELPPAGNYDIILKGENLAELFNLYGARSSASMIFPGYSKWKVGDQVQGEDVEGEKLNLFLEPVTPYSGEGIPMPERQLIADGELKLIYGSTRFCRYLGIEPTGDYSKIRCANGSKSLAEMQKAGVLEPISFSDFQMDEMDGHFKGEIRLALLHKEDGSVEELTGGSINGSLLDLQKNLVFSTEQYEDSSYSGPLAVLIPGVAVAGR